MQPDELIAKLSQMTPDFNDFWSKNDNEGTLHGVFAQYSEFFKSYSGNLSPVQMSQIGKFISGCMEGNDSALDHAAATSFLESLAGESPAKMLRPHLSGEALVHFLCWNQENDSE